jgi:hypothetical protein
MTLSTRDRDLVDSMKQREFSVKKQQRARPTRSIAKGVVIAGCCWL